MRFEAVGPGGRTDMGTDYKSCVYETSILQSMENAGYKFRIDGKFYKAGKVHEHLSTLPPDPPVKQSGTETGRVQCSAPNVSAVPKSVEPEPVVQVAADAPPYMVQWQVCKRSKSYDDTKSNAKQFTNKDEAIKFLQGKQKSAGSSYWAGGIIKDSNGKLILNQGV